MATPSGYAYVVSTSYEYGSDGYKYTVNKWSDGTVESIQGDQWSGSGGDNLNFGGGGTRLNYDPSNTIISGTSGNDTITNDGGRNVTILAGDGNDSVKSVGYENGIGNGLVVNLGGGNDTLRVTSSEYAVIFCGDGNDSVAVDGSFNYVNLGDGNDYMHYDADESTEFRFMSRQPTIYGGAGNDTIALTSDDKVNGAVIEYREGDGNDSIYGFASDDTLLIAADSFTTTRNGINLLVQVGDGSIDLFCGYYERNNLHIVRTSDFTELSPPTISSSSTSTSTPSTSSTSTSSSTTTSTTSTTSTTTTTPSTSTTSTTTTTPSTATTSHTYSGGNKSITNYSAGQKINFNADFTGIGFSGNNFMVNSSSGSLTIQNARNKVIDVAVGGNTVAYAYLASSGGAINGSGFSQLEVIIGGNNSANTITAGSGGSSLWGGSGGNDILTGGSGSDTFFYGKNDGADIINNASSADVVNLYDVRLSDITSATTSGRTISATFNTGSSLQINSAENLSATFKLADGNFKFNHSSGNWQSA